MIDSTPELGDPADGVSAELLTIVASLAEARRYKRHAIDWLELSWGQRVLDVGCGIGDDCFSLAARVGPKGEVVGVDRRPEMIARAEDARRHEEGNVRFLLADAGAMNGFEDASFDAARADRVLHGVADPGPLLTEMRRVVRPGGRVVVSEPDFTTLAIDCDRVDLSQRVIRRVHDAAAARPGRGGKLSDLMASVGLRPLHVARWTGSLTDFERAKWLLRLELMGLRAVLAGAITRAECVGWIASLRRSARAGHFRASMELVTVAAQVP